MSEYENRYRESSSTHKSEVTVSLEIRISTVNPEMCMATLNDKLQMRGFNSKVLEVHCRIGEEMKELQEYCWKCGERNVTLMCSYPNAVSSLLAFSSW